MGKKIIENSYKLERIIKGISNHHRISILETLGKESGLSVDDICQKLTVSFVTTSSHLQKMTNSGLIKKKYKGRQVVHSLTTRGKNILTFLRMLE